MKPFEDAISRALQEKADRLRQSEEHLKRYLNNGDPQIVIDLFLSSPYPLEENRWIVKVIAKWRREGEYDLLKKLFHCPRGVKKGTNDTFNLYGLTVVMVDTLASRGLLREEAFKRLASLQPFGSVETVRKAYYNMRKSKRLYRLYVEETDCFFVLTVYNARVHFSMDGTDCDLFGTYTVSIPKDSAEEVTFRVQGVTINDENFQRLSASLRRTR